MPIFALIGGKSNQEKQKNRIEEHLLKRTNKEKPCVLFCPYAAVTDMDKSIRRFHQLMEGLSCDIIDLTLKNIDCFETYFKQCDILYIGGGHCDELLAVFKEYALDKIIMKHMQSKILAGSSAGAMLYTYASMGDRYAYADNFHIYNYKMVDCLNFLNITICPHYQQEDLVVYNDVLRQYPCDAFGIEEDTMVVIEENQYYVIKENKNKSVYYFDRDKNYLMIPLYEGVLYEKNCSFRTKGHI